MAREVEMNDYAEVAQIRASTVLQILVVPNG
jgi:hypothetical protein